MDIEDSGHRVSDRIIAHRRRLIDWQEHRFPCRPLWQLLRREGKMAFVQRLHGVVKAWWKGAL